MFKQISLIFIFLLLSSSIIYAKTVDVYDIKGMQVMTTEIASDYTLPVFTAIPSINAKQMNENLQSLPYGIYIIQEKKPVSFMNDIPRLDPFFSDITGDDMPLEEYFSGSIAAADFNNDGYDDIVFFMEHQTTTEQNQPHIYMHQPDGRYLDETATNMPAFQEGGFNLLTLDIDQDSDKDILFISYFYGDNTTNWLFLNDGNGVFTIADSTFFPRIYADDANVFDVNEDGYPDLLCNVYDPATRILSRQLWINQNGTQLVQDTQNRIPSLYNLFLWGKIGLVDVDNDSHLDIICSNTVLNTAYYYTYDFVLMNLGNGYFTIPTVNPLHHEISNSIVTHIVPIDFDFDGDTDFLRTLILVNSTSVASLQLWINESGTFIRIPDAFPVNQFIHNGIGVADFNLDGYDDIFVPCVDYGIPEPDTYFTNNGDGTFTQDNSIIPPVVDFTTCISLIDINNDSKKDVTMANASGSTEINEGRGLNRLYMNSSGVANLDPVAVISGVSAYPNPFQSSINIRYSSKNPGNTHVEIYNLKGQKIRTFTNPNSITGSNICTWDGKDENGIACASGVYCFRLFTGDKSVTKKMVMMK